MTMTVFAYFLLVCPLLIGTRICAQSADVTGQPLSVSVSNASCNKMGALQFDWRLVNLGKTSIYIYSTFLKGPSAAYTVDKATQLRTIWTTLPKEADYAVNDYPPARFSELKPGAAIRGNFKGQHEDACSAREHESAKPIFIEMAVAIGSSPGALEGEMQRDHYVHPANPIVRWQKILRSRPVQLQVLEAR